ncbi:MAG: TonB-dependent receptor [Chloroherpetonaceae bacterium]|nr:TonB-dependent receptor [Chloroherpetonaceae bacterium]
MKRTTFIFILVLSPALLFAQTLSVKDRETGQPLASVKIFSQSPPFSGTTNRQGQADISALKEAKQIRIWLYGYKALTLSYAALQERNFEVQLEPSSFSTSEIVVSASKWSQQKRDVPNKITTISAKDVALYNPQTAADLLGVSGEVFIQKSQQGGGSPMIRGFATHRLLYSVDGVRMNTAIFRAGNIQNVISLDPFAIENTEIFFGPGSVIYGSDAIGGVMNFQTLSPKLAPTSESPIITGSAVGRFSSANREQTGHLDLNVGWKNFAFLTSFSSHAFDDLLMGRHGPQEYLRTFYVQRIDSIDRIVTNDNPLLQRPNAYSQINLMQKVRWQPTENWDAQYAFHFSETSEYARYDRLIETTSAGVPRSAVWNYGPQKWVMHHLSLSHSQPNALYDALSLSLALQFFEESRIDRNFSGSQRFRLRTQLEEVTAYSINLDFSKSIGDHQLYYGVEAVFNHVRSTGTGVDIRTNTPVAVADRYPQSNWSSLAAYLSYQYRFSEQVLLRGGVRYNQFANVSDFTRNLPFFPFDFTSASLNNGAIIGSLGAIFTPGDGWTVSLNASSGFRAPNVDDIGKIFEQPQRTVIVPNPNLRAEYAYNAELGLSKSFGDFAKVELYGYYTLLEGALVRRDFQVNGRDSIFYDGSLQRVQAIQNAAFARVYGFNASVDVQFPLGFRFSSRLNYQLGREEMDDGQVSPSRHAAPLFGLSRLAFTAQNLDAEFYAIYSGEVSFENLNVEERGKPHIYARDASGNPYSPSWLTLNFKALYRFSETLSVSAGIENLADVRYRPYSSGLVAPGRNFILSLRAAI